MALTVTHKFVSAKVNSGDLTLVNPSNWNDTHNIVSTSNIYYSDDYNWTQTPGGSLVVGSNVLTLNPIPLGIAVNNYVCITGGVGATEPALITGWNSSTGQIVFTCANTHSGAWTINSASSGIQEAIVQANSAGGGWIYLRPGSSVTSLCGPINMYNGCHLVGCGVYTTILQRTADYGDTFHMQQVHDCSFNWFTVQQYVNYQPGTPGSAINMPTQGSHFNIRGCNTILLNHVRLETMHINLTITGSVEIHCFMCQFYGIWDNRSGSPKITQSNVYIVDDPSMGIPTYIRFYGCTMVGNSNGTTNSPTNYNGVGAAFGYNIRGCEDMEIVGGSLGGCNNNNVLIAPDTSSSILAMVHIYGVKFDSAANGDLNIAPTVTTTNASIIMIDNNIFNGELVAPYGIYIANNSTGLAPVYGLTITNNIVFGYMNSGMSINDGIGIEVCNNLIYNYNLAKNTNPALSAGIYVGGRASAYNIHDNSIGGSAVFGDYDNVNNCCLYGIVAASPTGINNNYTPTPNSISTKNDLVFVRKTNQTTFANVPPTPVAGQYVTITDSNTVAWGATIGGGGTHNVLAFYNGTNWTVAGV